MKISIFTILFLLGFSTYSQVVRITNQSLTDSTKNILYVGVDNIIRFDKANTNYKLIVIGCEGTIASQDPPLYNIRVQKTGECIIEVVDYTKRVLTIKYKSVALKQGMATIAGVCNTTITKARLLANPFIMITIPDSYYKHNFGIRSFNAVFIINGDSTFTSALGHAFNKKQIELANKMQPGDELRIERPIAKCASGRDAPLPSFWIKIE